MMRSNFSRLAVLGLAAISGQVFAAVSLSGELRLDKKFPELPATTDDSLEFERVRLEVAGDVAADWTAHVRLEAKDAVSSTSAIAAERAYAQWTPLDSLTVLVGKAGHLDVDAESYYYAPTTTLHGALPSFGFQNDYGLSVHGSLGAFGYKLGLGKAPLADVTTEAQRVPFSFAGRGTFTAMNSDKMSWGLGLGFFNRKFLKDVSSEVATSSTTSEVAAVMLFPSMEGFTADLSGVVGKFALTAAVYTLKDKLSSATPQDATIGVSGTTGFPAAQNDTTASDLANNPYNKDGKADSFYVEAAYLVMGEGYRFADGVIHGPKFSSSALELGARVSQSTHKNASAKLHHAAFDATGLTPLAASGDAESFAAGDEYKVKTDAYSLFANYHVNSNAVVKVEFFNSKAKTTQNVNASPVADVKARHLNVRAQFNF
jgi:hypothetical protein